MDISREDLAAGDVVEIMTVSPSSADDPVAREELAVAHSMPGEPAEFTAGAPTRPWQMLVVIEDGPRKIRLEGYGPDLTKPVIVREYQYE